jgi:iron(III) transport system ATP-binding protein
MPEQAPYLQVRNVHKSFGKAVALDDVSLDISPGEFVFLLGPSGCGKTTLLRIIAGLEAATRGQILQGGQDVTHLPPSRRNFGIVFQSYALFPNLTVAQNVAYGLKSTRRSATQIATRVRELLHLVGLQELAGRYPAQLSGGQQQRVALARALAIDPELLLLDEPLSALDARVRANLRIEIAALQKRLGVTTIMVTHDQEEALTMADRIVVMDRGHIVQSGSPLEIYQHPATPFVADFVGHMNFLPGVVTGQQPAPVRCGTAPLAVHPWPDHLAPGTHVTLAIRPEEVQVLDEGQSAPNLLQTTVRIVEFAGPFYRLHLHLAAGNGHAGKLMAYLPRARHSGARFQEGQEMPVHVPAGALRVFADPGHGK